jgi:L-alanine-DL-glutamate epimerase-like enolase superfamily enzyme
VPPTPDPARLGETLAALPLLVEDVTCEVGSVAVPSFGGARPTSVVTLRGRRATGRGENVAWTETAQEHFAAHARVAPRGGWCLGEWAAAMREVIGEPYERAALEAAAIDLALRQARTSLFELAGVTPTLVRYVVSFGKVADPVVEAQLHAAIELKVDVAPEWSDDTYRALADLGRVAILDFKWAGEHADHERAHRLLPGALIEDPLPGPAVWSPSLTARLSFDAPLTAASELPMLPARPAFVNLKPARMGGVLEAVACAERCADEGIGIYVGGMFEVGIGRAQLRMLAAVLSPEGPNDIAPIGRGNDRPVLPPRLAVSAAPGFGDNA